MVATWSTDEIVAAYEDCFQDLTDVPTFTAWLSYNEAHQLQLLPEVQRIAEEYIPQDVRESDRDRIPDLSNTNSDQHSADVAASGIDHRVDWIIRIPCDRDMFVLVALNRLSRFTLWYKMYPH